MQWLSNFGAGVNYDALKETFLNWFWEEKTPHDILAKFKDIKQKRMFVEDYAQKFNQYLNRLTMDERPIDEMLAGYVMNGLQKDLWMQKLHAKNTPKTLMKH